MARATARADGAGSAAAMAAGSLLALCLLAAGARAQDSSATRAPAPDAVELTGVKPGDVVRLWVWREEDLSGEFPVDERGTVTLPLIGDVETRGKTAEALTAEIKEAYARYLRNPSIQVTVLRRIAVQGSVGKPGLYPVDPTVTVAQVIALAGGVTESGDPNKVRLRRNGTVLLERLGAETVLQTTPVRSGDEVYVPQRPWLNRNANILLWGAVTVVSGVMINFIVN